MQELLLPSHRPRFLFKAGHRWWDTSRWCLDQQGHFTHTLGSKEELCPPAQTDVKKKSDSCDTHLGDGSPRFAQFEAED